ERGRRAHATRLFERDVRLRPLRQPRSGGGRAARARRDGPPGAQQGLAGEVVRPRLRVPRTGRIARGRRAARSERRGRVERRDRLVHRRLRLRGDEPDHPRLPRARVWRDRHRRRDRRRQSGAARQAAPVAFGDRPRRARLAQGSRRFRSHGSLAHMDPFYSEWLNLLLRWFHVFAGILWIGSTWYFTWLDKTIHASPEGVWMVHSGGFYLVEK